ncbi:MAG: hypothetical protein ACI4BH_08935, partial [Muribaculaceae bacterium]
MSAVLAIPSAWNTAAARVAHTPKKLVSSIGNNTPATPRQPQNIPFEYSSDNVPMGLNNTPQHIDGEGVAYVLVEESFERLSGPIDKPDLTKPIALTNGAEVGPFIDASLTDYHTWSGDNVYSSNKAIALVGHGFYNMAYINTPIGDFSGKITLTYKAKPVQEEGNNAYIFVDALIGGIFNSSLANTNNIINEQVNLYPNDVNWTEVTFDNYSANNDGYIQISCPSEVLIKDIKITTEPTFIANPVIEKVDFNKNGFDISWQPVRRAFDYWLTLYEMKTITSETVSFSENFENAQDDGTGLPEGWNFIQQGGRISEDGGKDGSRGAILAPNDTIYTTNNNCTYNDLKLWIKAFYSEGFDSENDWNSEIAIEGLYNGKWITVASYYNAGFVGEYAGEVDVKQDIEDYYGWQFSNKYTQFRFYLYNPIDPSSYVVLDDICYSTDGAAEMSIVETYDGYNYTIVAAGEPGAGSNGTSFSVIFNKGNGALDKYPYTGLSPEGNYYFQLRSHYLYKKSDGNIIKVSGTVVPEPLPASAIGERSYTANWQAAPKATGYIVSNYGVVRIASDVRDFEILKEQFSKTTSNATSTDPEAPEILFNDKESSLDAYTDFSGWRGRCNTMCQGFLGCESGQNGYLITPEMSLGNTSECFVTLSVMGVAGDVIKLTTSNGKAYYTTLIESDVPQEVEFIVDDCCDNMTFRLSSNNYNGWMTNGVRVTQNLKQGNSVYYLLSKAEVAAP